MNIQVNKHQSERVVIKWLNKYYGNLTPKKHKDHPNSVFYLNSVFYVNSDNEVLIEYNKKNEYLFIHYDQIWSKLESLFHLDYDNIEPIIKV